MRTTTKLLIAQGVAVIVMALIVAAMLPTWLRRSWQGSGRDPEGV